MMKIMIMMMIMLKKMKMISDCGSGLAGRGGSMGGCQRLMLPRPYQVSMSVIIIIIIVIIIINFIIITSGA